jgi:hypothetical protein
MTHALPSAHYEPLGHPRDGRIFPTADVQSARPFAANVGTSKLTIFTSAICAHEGTSRLFEADFSIEQVALVTGHKDWKMLRRYAHLKPDMKPYIRGEKRTSLKN